MAVDDNGMEYGPTVGELQRTLGSAVTTALLAFLDSKGLTIQAKPKPCPGCDGSGTDGEGASKMKCPECSGSGAVLPSDLLAALTPIAQSASNVLNDDGSWNGRERIKDWFDYDDLLHVLTVARSHGWEANRG